jgi:hypothetical protein
LAAPRPFWFLVPGGRPIRAEAPPPGATWWCREGDPAWQSIPPAWIPKLPKPDAANSGPRQRTLFDAPPIPEPPVARAQPTGPGLDPDGVPHGRAPGPPDCSEAAPSTGSFGLSAAPRAPLSPVRPPAPHPRGRRRPAPGQRTLSFADGAAGPARPFLRWPGGKTYLLPQISQLLSGFPCEQFCYLEAMVGGGAAYWKFSPRFRRCTISDLNPDLVNLYKIVQNDVDRLIAELRSGAYEYQGNRDPVSRANFRRLLDSEPADPLLRAARYIYIYQQEMMCRHDADHPGGQAESEPQSPRQPRDLRCTKAAGLLRGVAGHPHPLWAGPPGHRGGTG